MRVFIGIPIPGNVKTNITNHIEPYKVARATACATACATTFDDLRWVNPDCYHITLLFIGEVRAEEVSRIKNRLRGIELPRSFHVKLGRMERFPPRKGPLRVLVLSLESGGNECSLLYRSISGRFDEYVDRRTYRPHITLARGKSRSKRGSRDKPDKSIDDQNFWVEEPSFSGGFDVTRVVLFESKLTPKGAQYTEIESYNLGARTPEDTS